jgi:tetratricopeptide (TPR) repeat protein
MIKLKEVIAQLNDVTYESIEKILIKNKADNFVLLLQSYKKGNIPDSEISSQLGISSNSFYVLKSRLYDKIQESLSAGTFSTQENIIKQLLQVHEVCFNSPREIAVAFLHKLETELLRFDMHNELQVVYSALKKMHLYSDKYFYYSQLFNKHVALGLSLEKAEEILGNFNRILGQYNFSRSREHLETLNFINREIINLYALNGSRQIEIIKNIIELQLVLFCSESRSTEHSAEELLKATKKLFDELPETSPQKKWEIALDYLYFEHYQLHSQYKTALPFYEKVNEQLDHFLLYNNICLSSKFLVSKTKFCYESNRVEDISMKPSATNILFDTADSHARVLVALYNSMLHYNQNSYKEAIAILNEIINTFGFKDFFHESINIKLTLAYFYLLTGEFDMVDMVLKGISRKIKAEKLEKYDHVMHLIKVFDIEINKNKTDKQHSRKRDLITLFLANNNKDVELLMHLVPELRKKYQS